MWKTIIKIVEKLACSHDWEILYKKDYEDKERTERWSDNGRSAHTRMVIKCTKCGKLKTIII